MSDTSLDRPPPTPSFARRGIGKYVPLAKGDYRGLIIGTIFLALTFMLADVQFRYASRIVDGSTFDASRSTLHASAAIVLGASVNRDGTPSDALRDRLNEGVALYDAKAVDRIFVTGDDGDYHADEIDVMKSFLIQRGIPADKLAIDGKGFRTYESCKHAAEAGIKTAIVVTQRFHMGRALYLCNRMGVDATGVTSDLSSYDKNWLFWARDLLASVEAWWDVNVMAPKPPAN